MSSTDQHNTDQLLEENALLRAELQLLRSQQAITTDRLKTPEAKTTPFRCLDLPKELRLMIYECALVPGIITLRYKDTTEDSPQDTRYTALDVPSTSATQLFGVCKLIKDEARPIYLAQNKFEFSPLLELCELEELFHVAAVVYGLEALQHICHISLAFDFRAPIPIIDRVLWEARAARFEGDASRTLYCHGMVSGVQSSTWCHFGQILGWFTRFRTVEVNVGNTYCPLGCCRFAGKASDVFTGEQWCYSPKELRILGARVGVEKGREWRLGYDFVRDGTVVSFV